MRTLLLLAVAFMVGCAAPTFDDHCQTCKQCHVWLFENGQEQGLCEEGYRLWQDDARWRMGR